MFVRHALFPHKKTVRAKALCKRARNITIIAYLQYVKVTPQEKLFVQCSRGARAEDFDELAVVAEVIIVSDLGLYQRGQ